MTIGISMLKNIFPLHPKTQNYHLKYPNVLLSLNKLLMLTNSIILAMNGRNIQASSLGPWQMMYITLNTINGVVQFLGDFCLVCLMDAYLPC